MITIPYVIIQHVPNINVVKIVFCECLVTTFCFVHILPNTCDLDGRVIKIIIITTIEPLTVGAPRQVQQNSLQRTLGSVKRTT